LYKNLKDINFTTLKQRHDNFSFEKALESRPLVYDTIHFLNVDQPSTEKQDIYIFPKMQKAPFLPSH
jgi:hypothetical protein